MRDDDALLLPPRLLAMPSYVLSLLGRAARAGSVEAVAGNDLRLGHVAVLAALADLGPSSQRDLGARLRQDPSDVVGLLDDLQRRALVHRERDPDDRRRQRVSITAAGRRALSAAERAVARREDALLDALTARERAELHRLAAKALAGADPRARRADR
jgi:MarR family transcriptional regulator, lower aerobic nicotinate degradation pathway regulator